MSSVARYWRMEQDLYRQQGGSCLECGRWSISGRPNCGEGSHQERTGEFDGRQMGAMLVLETVGRKVFVMPDEGKLEMASGYDTPLFVYGPADGVRLGMPGGGWKKGESIRDTLSREMTEEIGILMPSNLKLEIINKHFLIVNQPKMMADGGCEAIHQIAVWACRAFVTPGSYLDRVLQTKGKWVPEEKLLNCLFGQDEDGYLYRPHALLAVGLMNGMISEDQLNIWNQEVIDRAYGLAAQFGNLPVKNGVVRRRGGGIEEQSVPLVHEFLRV